MITKLLRPILKLLGKEVYCQDGLITIHNHDFMKDPAFLASYTRGVLADGRDFQCHWRIHAALWAAHQATKVDGDFVECGVNRGFVSSAILSSIRWNTLDRSYYLLDTFTGPEEELLSSEERASGYVARKAAATEVGFYATSVEKVAANFSEWSRVKIIKGAIPGTLKQVTAEKIAFIHIDLNCSVPEVAALDHFWPFLSPGAIVLLDDYAYVGFRLSKQAMDKFALKKNVPILSLPTGQGLIVKPHE
jgi:hypothetical protein